MAAAHHVERGGSYHGEGRRALLAMALLLLAVALCAALAARASPAPTPADRQAHFSALAGTPIIFYGPNGASWRLPTGGMVTPRPARSATAPVVRRYPVRSGST